MNPQPLVRKAPAPMPRKVKPMLAAASRAAQAPSGWVLEPDFMGLRALAEVEGKRVHLYSRAGLSFAKKFPRILEELGALNVQALLDGDVALNRAGAIYHVFDVLYADEQDLRSLPLEERKHILARLFADSPHVRKVPAEGKIGSRFQAKNPRSLYRSGISADWLCFVSKTGKINTLESTSREPRLSHLDKIYFPKDRITKGDVIGYYKAVAPYMLPYLKDRPESLNRHPNGIDRPGFYQKDMTGFVPRWLKMERIYSGSSEKTIDYVLCQDERSLLYLANLGCIEFNPWFSRVGNLDKPDFLVIDLDPDGNSFDHVIAVALDVHRILQKLHVPNFCKTSGATGLHVAVPAGARYEFDEVREFAERVSALVAKKHPATTSLERNPNRRRGRIYIDFMQNRRGQTLAAPYCIRPRPGAPVSMPLRWKELKPGLRPEDFNIFNALKRVRRVGDLWRGVLGRGFDLAKAVKELEKLEGLLM